MLDPGRTTTFTDAVRQTRRWLMTISRTHERWIHARDLTGFCGRGTARLFAHLGGQIHSTRSHFFLVVDGHVLDATATQFWDIKQRPFPPVLVEPLKEMRRYYPWKDSDIITPADLFFEARDWTDPLDVRASDLGGVYDDEE